MRPLQASIWPSLREAAGVLCPPFEVVSERPGALSVTLRDPARGEELSFRYRSERGFFHRTYFLVVEAEIAGAGPSEPGVLRLRRRRLRWKQPRPPEADVWARTLGSADVRRALKGLPVDRLTLRWEPGAGLWLLRLQTLVGGVTVTFFPPLATPNPLLPQEAEAVRELVAALARAAG